MPSPQKSDEAMARPENGTDAVTRLAARVAERGPSEAADLLEPEPDDIVVQVLQAVSPTAAQDILDAFVPERRQSVMAAAPPECSRQWSVNCRYPDGSVGRLMDAPLAVFRRSSRRALARRSACDRPSRFAARPQRSPSGFAISP